MKTVSIKIRDNHFSLYPQKGIFWEEQKILLVSDLHIGKTAAFRAAGIPVPGGVTTDDLKRLNELIKLTTPKQLIILGDLLHSKINNKEKTLNALKLWRVENPSLDIILIKGNHDKETDPFFQRLKIDLFHETKILEEFAFSHSPGEADGKFIFSGHIHPAVRLMSKARIKEQLQCFYFSEDFAVLPSFGSFTGNFVIKPKDFEKVYVIAGDEVIEISNNTIDRNLT